jgi:CDP-glucose 4,6-dehydratase
LKRRDRRLANRAYPVRRNRAGALRHSGQESEASRTGNVSLSPQAWARNAEYLRHGCRRATYRGSYPRRLEALTPSSDLEGLPATIAGLRGKRVLVTGHTGFVGSWLSSALCLAGAEVVGISALSTPLSVRRSQQLGSLGIRTHKADLTAATSAGLLNEVVGEADVVVHGAAQALVTEAIRNPELTLRTNVGGLQTILEAVRSAQSVPLVTVTSDKCYGRGSEPGRGLSEGDHLRPSGIYETSKAIQEFLCHTYRTTYDLPITTIRLANVVGGGDVTDRLVPNCIQAFEDGRTVCISDETAIRPWQSVLDVCEGFLRLLARSLRGGWKGGSLNFAPPSQEITVGDLVRHLVAGWSGPAGWRVEANFRGLPEEHILQVDGRLAARVLSWQHRHLAPETLVSLIYEWHEVSRRDGPGAATIGQLRRHMGLETKALSALTQ